MSFFADFLEKLEDDKSKDIQAFLEGYDDVVEDLPPLGPEDRIRASSIWDFCARREAIRWERQLTLHDEISGRLSRIFRFGRVFERYLRDTIFGGHDLLIGKWKCISCDFIPPTNEAGDGIYKKPTAACKCGANAWSYFEVEKIDPSTGVGGSNDGFIYWGNDYAILEVKTANEWSYKAIIKRGQPDIKHIAQAQIYMHLHGYKRALVWYYNKNTSEQKTFWLDYDAGFVQSLLDKARAYREYHKSKTMPARMCSDHRCPRAKECPVKTICFKEMPA